MEMLDQVPEPDVYKRQALYWQWGQLTLCGAEGEMRSLSAPPRGP